GVALDRLRPAADKGNYALVLGRICPEKGFHLAIQATRAAGVPLIIAGEAYNYPDHQEYFRTSVEPNLGPDCRFVGPAHSESKRDLIAGARCVLVPSLVPETSSLVSMEALACGTPVIAFRQGALVDIIQDGVTGFLVSDVQEMAEALKKVDILDPQVCRRYAEEHFSLDRMVNRYLEYYSQLADIHPPALSTAQYSTDVVRSVKDLQKIESEWDHLFQRCPNATPFSSPAWQLAWLRHLAQGEPHVITIRRAGQLEAIAPLVQNNGKLELVGFGESDYLDVLGSTPMSFGHLWETLEQQDLPVHLADLRWDSCAIRHLPSDLALKLEDGCVCPVVNLKHFALPVKLLKNLRGQLRRLSETYGTSVETADATTLPEYFSSLFELHAARWKTRDQNGVLSTNPLQNFHRCAGERLQQQGLLRLYGLRIEGTLRSVIYCLSRGSTIFYYIGGFAPELEAYSPGSLLIHHAINQAAGSGAAEFDMLRGVEPYKYRWGATNRLSRTLRIG
ncbi:MAG TPA: GNAT family N-acetyltransferase, partial [Bryobacteraceae bacterium]|nr:GNAT family N-acetyltransferase [Bryobacteraceae bacterium]